MKFKEYLKLNENDDLVFKGIADAISRNSATRKEAVEKWLRKHYKDSTEANKMMAKYASKKDYLTIAKAFMADKKL